MSAGKRRLAIRKAEDLVGRARRDKQARHAYAASALRARRVHDEAIRARLLGGGLPRIGRSNRRQRRTRNGRQIISAKHLCRSSARRLSWAIQVDRRLYPPGNPLLRSGLSNAGEFPSARFLFLDLYNTRDLDTLRLRRGALPSRLHRFLELVTYDLARARARDLSDQLHAMRDLVRR